VVSQAILIYVMSGFLIPKGVFCKRMMDVISKFWWGDDENRRCIGTHGGSCVFQTMKVAWDLEISILSIWPCWLSNS
jgi:hypothetical protein